MTLARVPVDPRPESSVLNTKPPRPLVKRVYLSKLEIEFPVDRLKGNFSYASRKNNAFENIVTNQGYKGKQV